MLSLGYRQLMVMSPRRDTFFSLLPHHFICTCTSHSHSHSHSTITTPKPLFNTSVLQSSSLSSSSYFHSWRSSIDSSSPLKPLPLKLPTSLPELRENIYTIPNWLSFGRLISTPILGYLIIKGHYHHALGIFVTSAITDMLDGYIARTFHMKSVLGSVLDPMADKALMTTLTISLSMAGLIPVSLASLIIGRDLCLTLSAFIIRYKSLPPPKNFTRFWDFSLVSAEVRPTMISKINTLLQLLYMGTALSATSISMISSVWVTWNVPAQYLVATTTIWSGLSYVFSKDAVRYLHPLPPSPSPPKSS